MRHHPPSALSRYMLLKNDMAGNIRIISNDGCTRCDGQISVGIQGTCQQIDLSSNTYRTVQQTCTARLIDGQIIEKSSAAACISDRFFEYDRSGGICKATIIG